MFFLLTSSRSDVAIPDALARRNAITWLRTRTMPTYIPSNDVIREVTRSALVNLFMARRKLLYAAA
jgi:hypothetical protein